MSDISAPPSPMSDSSSEPRSPSGAGGLVEPMDLTDFIGSLNDGKGPNGGTKGKTRESRKGSIGGSKDVDDNAREKESRRLLDFDYNYQQYVCAEDFDFSKKSSSESNTGKNDK
ncbi:protein of unknown function [Taphrina deformans PYCC 5710]|uniref:Uncharacterized protein n=1 Tax=Taphrina deformans (strain PYCC 5710 / ATCC 11124 / CBS 356.35 / IMI 108563 / JCM 9778 / NBRC 8474) TaxID=1097556 RepID=R4ZY16_TAPDE|nr:protein of unknown function [Taphrina deformans PYCC 5710]|eukprot:CCX35418.1 protein of unknown function [Taphrina deformans PYCC 5710]